MTLTALLSLQPVSIHLKQPKQHISLVCGSLYSAHPLSELRVHLKLQFSFFSSFLPPLLSAFMQQINKPCMLGWILS